MMTCCGLGPTQSAARRAFKPCSWPIISVIKAGLVFSDKGFVSFISFQSAQLPSNSLPGFFLNGTFVALLRFEQVQKVNANYN